MTKNFEARWPETTFRRARGRLFKTDNKNVAIFMQPGYRNDDLRYVALQLLVGPYKRIEQDFYYDVDTPPQTKTEEFELLDEVGAWAIKESEEYLRENAAQYADLADSLRRACGEDTENA